MPWVALVLAALPALLVLELLAASSSISSLLGRGPSIDPRTRAPRRASTASTLAAADLVRDSAGLGILLLAVRALLVTVLHPSRVFGIAHWHHDEAKERADLPVFQGFGAGRRRSSTRSTNIAT
jgi:hypothetical protein